MHTDLVGPTLHGHDAATVTARAPAGPQRPAGIAYGGDYNPEQWPERGVGRGRRADAARPGSTWSASASSPGRCWSRGRAGTTSAGSTGCSTCCTPPASRSTWPPRPPPRRPGSAPRTRRSRPVTRDGRAARRRRPGRRSARARRRTAAPRPAITEQLARRYADHPALVMWHVHNEYGAPRRRPATATRARRRSGDWLRDRYGDLDALNEAWGTAFWGQRYGDWDEIDAAAAGPDRGQPGPAAGLHALHLRRALLRLLPGRARHPAPAQPRRAGDHQLHGQQLQERSTTGRWAAEVDVVANDHYLRRRGPGQPHRPGAGRRPDPVAGRRRGRGC